LDEVTAPVLASLNVHVSQLVIDDEHDVVDFDPIS